VRLSFSTVLALILAPVVIPLAFATEQPRVEPDPVVPPTKTEVTPGYNGPLSCAYHCVCPYTCLDASPCEGARIRPPPDNSKTWPYTTSDTLSCVPAPCSDRDPAKAQRDCYFHCKKSPNTKIGFYCPSRASRTGTKFVRCKDRIVRPSSSTVTQASDQCRLGPLKQ
jgi:hypothetical protein